jgi:TRAP-type C4-dicarboxylate transport system permease small subunit
MITKFLGRVTKDMSLGLEYISIVALALLMFIGAADVIGRYVFDVPIRGVYGICRMLMVAMVFLAMASAHHFRAHVTLDAVCSRLGAKTQAVLGIITGIAALVIFSLLTWQSALKALNSFGTTEVLDVLNWPVWPFQFLVPIGIGMLCLEILVQLVNHFIGFRGKAILGRLR